MQNFEYSIFLYLVHLKDILTQYIIQMLTLFVIKYNIYTYIYIFTRGGPPSLSACQSSVKGRKEAEGMTESFVHDPSAQMETGLQESDFSESAQLFLEYKKYVGLGSLETSPNLH